MTWKVRFHLGLSAIGNLAYEERERFRIVLRFLLAFNFLYVSQASAICHNQKRGGHCAGRWMYFGNDDIYCEKATSQ